MTENKRFELIPMGTRNDIWYGLFDNFKKEYVIDKLWEGSEKVCDKLNELADENEELKKELKRCKDWINSDKNDYELTLAFIKNKGYSLKDVLKYEKELQKK